MAPLGSRAMARKAAVPLGGRVNIGGEMLSDRSTIAGDTKIRALATAAAKLAVTVVSPPATPVTSPGRSVPMPTLATR
jgi:hypothetical protein